MTMAQNLKKERIGCFLREDFDFILNFFVEEIRSLNKVEKIIDYKQLLEISKHSFYLQSFLDDMVFFGYKEIKTEAEKVFKLEFNSKKILIEIQKKSIRKALCKISGQFLIGENEYIVDKSKIYYRSLAGKWFEISSAKAFLLLPDFSKTVGINLSRKLDAIYKFTEIDKIYKLWLAKKWNKKIDKKFIRIKTGITKPDEYFNNSIDQISAILKNPVSLEAIKKSANKGDLYMEQLIKVSYKIIKFVNIQRNKSDYLVHLLRDGMMFAEAQKTMDFLKKEQTDSCQIMVSRKLMSSPDREEFYWSLTVDALYYALRKHKNTFSLFYREYKKEMRRQEDRYPDLKNFFVKLSTYIGLNIKPAIGKGKSIKIIDTGLQGSINMLVKYLIDNYINEKVNTDIGLFITGDWFKNVYKNKYFSDYYPMMKDIEIFMRSDQLYHYKKGSFEKGLLKVKMGEKRFQILANLELFVLVQMCVLMNEKKYI